MQRSVAAPVVMAAVAGYHNIGFRCGSGIVVIDVDMHEGRDDGRKLLSEMLPIIPHTVQVSTGGGGIHLYFVVPDEKREHLRSYKLAGIDIKYDGSYVVMPPSAHASGKHYEWINPPWTTPMAPLPECFYQRPRAVSSQQIPTLSDGLSREQIRSALSAIDPDCDYETWVTIGMALKDAGFPCELWDLWSSAGAKYKSGECHSKWKSFQKSGATVGTIVYLAQERGWRPPQLGPVGHVPCVYQPERAIEYVKIEPEFKEQNESTMLGCATAPSISGLVFAVGSGAVCRHPLFDIQAAISSISALSGTYRSPTNGKLSFYSLLVSPPGGGKQYYTSVVRDIVREICPTHISMGEPQSRQALRTMWAHSNLRLCCVGEMSQFLGRIFSDTHGVGSGITQDLFDVWGNEFFLEKLPTKHDEESGKDIENPYLVLHGGCTRDGFERLMTSQEMCEKGFLSRLEVIQSFISDDEENFEAKFALPDDAKQRLLLMSKSTLEAIGGPHYVLGHDVRGKKDISMKSHCKVAWDSDIKKKWECYRKTKRELMKRENDLVSSILSRMPEKALRYASLLAVYENPVEPRITIEQLEWGCSWVDAQSNSVIPDSRIHGLDSEQERLRETIISRLKTLGGKAHLWQITNGSRVLRRASQIDLLAAYQRLEMEGHAVRVTGKDGKSMELILLRK